MSRRSLSPSLPLSLSGSPTELESVWSTHQSVSVEFCVLYLEGGREEGGEMESGCVGGRDGVSVRGREGERKRESERVHHIE